MGHHSRSHHHSRHRSRDRRSHSRDHSSERKHRKSDSRHRNHRKSKRTSEERELRKKQERLAKARILLLQEEEEAEMLPMAQDASKDVQNSENPSQQDRFRDELEFDEEMPIHPVKDLSSEIDPLDQYMMEIDKEAVPQEGKARNQQIDEMKTA
ncbi:unnamed protein product [Blepharisma stoltei]|uniref:Uncharacterized protein n=1 Tax=Blepharisma stoltei TaxID=1481888 RepID=A0AAU9IXX5_9CILI|nr:unnamed protein product [Blepharisma stoltei]